MPIVIGKERLAAPGQKVRCHWKLPEGQELYITVDGIRKLNDQAEAAGFFNECTVCQEWFEDFNTHCGENGHIVCGPCATQIKGRRNENTGPVTLIIPPAYQMARIDHLEPKAKAKLSLWPNANKFIAIYGIPESGKTYASWATLIALAKTGKVGHLENCTQCKTRWLSSLPLARQKIENMLKNAPYLVLDEFPAYSPTDLWRDLVKSVLEIRVDFKRPTMITSSASASVLAEAVGSKLQQFDVCLLARRKS